MTYISLDTQDSQTVAPTQPPKQPSPKSKAPLSGASPVHEVESVGIATDLPIHNITTPKAGGGGTKAGPKPPKAPKAESTYATADPKFAGWILSEGLLDVIEARRNGTGFLFTFRDPLKSGSRLLESFKAEEKPKIVQRAGFTLDDGTIVEAIAGGKYLLWRGGEVLETRWTLTMPDGSVRKPPRAPDAEEERQRVLLLPSKAAPEEDETVLYADTRKLIHKYVDLPNEWEDICAHYVFLTWVYECFRALPYLRFLGNYGTGKTTMLEVVREICFRPMLMNGASSIAAIYRLIHQWRGTVALDESDFKDAGEWAEVVKILNAGYRVDNPVTKCEQVGGRYEPRSYYVYGPKLLSTRRKFADEALESRCLTYRTTTSRKVREDIPVELPESFFTEGAALRDRFLTWRLQNFQKINPASTRLAGAEMRLSQIVSPLFAVAKTQEFKTLLLNFSRDFSRERRDAREEILVLEGIRRAVGMSADELTSSAPTTKSKPLTLGQIRAGVDLVAIADGAVREGKDADSMPASRVGELLRSMGLTLVRRASGMVVPFTAENVEQLAAQRKVFGLDGT